ncbi:MAG: hypothetical protein ACREFQ_00130, partial [Stellaceae bacterium]
MADGGVPGDRTLLAHVLARPDIAPIAVGRSFAVLPDLPLSFRCRGQAIELGVMAVAAPLAIIVRHALELGLALDLFDDPALAGLIAARTAALFARLESDGAASMLPSWHSCFAADEVPHPAVLDALWPLLGRHQEPPAPLKPDTAARLAALWCFGGPAEHVMGLGGDTRLKLDPATGLNVYGCSPRPRPWAVTFASSTASSVSERGYDGAEEARRRLLADAARLGATEAQKRASARVKAGILRHYGLGQGVAAILTPSGTDGELSALAVSLLGGGAPLTNILIAPEETGSGVPLAATGRHFATLTARGLPVAKGEPIAGFPAGIALEAVPIRGRDGGLRPDAEIAADCWTRMKRALDAGRRVLLHVLDVSKTGFRAPGDFSFATHPDVDIVVDACQARLSAVAVRAYLAMGAMVLITGSKFFTGPPFAGALLLPPTLAARFAATAALPSGLEDYFGGFDWPEGTASAALPREANFGLACRWAAALAEMEAFAAVSDAERRAILGEFGARISAGIGANPDLVPHETPIAAAPGGGWHGLPTIFTFSMLSPKHPRAPLSPDAARLV